jgi:DNA-directed RNA polymerase beta' subunit
MSKLSTPGERVRYTALLRAFLNTGKREATSLLNTSKENLARDLYSVRTKNSARCPIVPSVDLRVDEIGVPRSLAYEMCREGFLGYLQKELNFTREEALKATRDEAMNPETQKLFKEYAEKQVVLSIL